MFTTECPVKMLVTDPDGLRVGYDLALNQTFYDIPDTLYYYGNGSEPEMIFIPNQKDGNYTVDVSGIESGTYNLTITSSDENGTLTTDTFTNLPIEKDESQVYVIPEFASLIILPLFMTLTLLAAIVFKKHNRRKVSNF